jgi:hypothetical protein
MIISNNQGVTKNYTILVYRRYVTMDRFDLEYLEWEIEIDHFRYQDYDSHPNQAVVRIREATHYLYKDHTEMKEFDKWKEVRSFDIDRIIHQKKLEGFHLEETHTIRDEDVKKGRYFPVNFERIIPKEEEGDFSDLYILED